MQKKTLVITGDIHGESVYTALPSPKAIFRTNKSYSININILPDTWSAYIYQDDNVIDLKQIGNVYIRRPIPLKFNSDTPRHVQEFIVRESMEIVSMFAAFCKYKQSGNLYCNGKKFNLGKNKIVQLIAASESGILIPETCITNMPEVANEFFAKFNGDIVYKCLSAPIIEYDDGKRSMIHTNKVLDNDFSNVVTCPCLFQRNINKLYEFRIAVIGSKTVSVKINSQLSEISKQDWRKNMSDQTMYSMCDIDSDVIRKIFKLHSLLDIGWGMVDMIICEDGSYIFLESNPDGAWLWLESAIPSLAITEHLAEYITTP